MAGVSEFIRQMLIAAVAQVNTKEALAALHQLLCGCGRFMR